MPSTNYDRVDPLHLRMTTPRQYGGSTLASAMDYIGELSQTSHFKLSLYMADSDTSTGINKWLQECGVFGGGDNNNGLKYEFLCHRAIIPGAQFELSTEQGSFQGITETFARARQFPQLTLDFYVDTNYNIIRLFEEWMNYINPLYTDGGSLPGSPAGSLANNSSYDSSNYYRMRYPEDYKRKIAVTKFERNAGFQVKDQAGNQAALRSNQLTYVFMNAFPVQFISIPLSYEASDILKCSIVFNYDRYITNKHDASGTTGIPDYMNLSPTTKEAINKAPVALPGYNTVPPNNNTIFGNGAIG